MSSPPPKKSTRKVGAPYGNHNALKHGFYSPHFRDGELSALASVDPKAYGMRSLHLASLIKTQKLLDHQYPQASEDLAQALAEVAKELGLQPDAKPA